MASEPPALRVKFLEMTIDAPLTEWNPPRRREIGGDPGSFGNPIVQRDQNGNFSLETFHPLRKRITQSFDNLKQRQIHITDAAADCESAAVVFQHPLEIAEIFRNTVAPEILAAPSRRRPLLLEIEPA